MPRGTNHKKARQNNLRKARDSHKVTVEEVPDEDDPYQTSDLDQALLFQLPPPTTWDLNLGNELPDLDCEESALGDLQPELDDEIVEAPEIADETELQKFATLLSDAQTAARIQDLGSNFSTHL
ncbi:hypothetical protein B0H14DRAFT_3159677 [Mycena olivaceomarginata]|nr:hypothetical protein B0H14DRAFT_3159677 [Mycena olivaceomarginata]